MVATRNAWLLAYTVAQYSGRLRGCVVFLLLRYDGLGLQLTLKR